MLVRIVLLMAILRGGNCDSDHKVDIVFDFITNTTAPTTVTAFMCWHHGNSRNLLRKIINSNSYRVTTILEVTRRPLPYPFPAHHALFVVDLECPQVDLLLGEADNFRLFAAPYRWLMLSSNWSDYHFHTEDRLSRLGIFPDSNVVIASQESNPPSAFQLMQPYKVRKGDPIIHQSYGTWNLETGVLDQRGSPILSHLRTDLRGTLITVSLVITNNDSLNHLDDYRNRHVDTVTKVNYFFSNYLIDAVNGTRRFTHVKTWGYKHENSTTYSGMMGELQRNEADLGGTALFFTIDRMPFIAYVAPTTKSRVKFVFRPPPLSYVSNVFTLPFVRSVWISEMGLVCIISVFLYLAVAWEWNKARTNPQEVVKEDLGVSTSVLQRRFGDVVMVTLGAICQQGTPVEPRSGSGRVTLMLLFMVLMFLYTAYSANIVALLQSSSSSIQTLSDLLNSRLKVGTHDTAYNHYYFETATEPVRKAIYETKVAPKGEKPHFMTLEEGVQRLRQGLYAFHMEVGIGYKLVGDTFLEHEKCGLQEIEYLQVIDPWLAVPKNSSFQEIFKVQFKKIHERGIQSREMQRLYTKKPKCQGNGNSFGSVGLVDIYGAFYVLLIGIGAALLIFVSEMLYERVKEKRQVHPKFIQENN